MVCYCTNVNLFLVRVGLALSILTLCLLARYVSRDEALL